MSAAATHMPCNVLEAVRNGNVGQLKLLLSKGYPVDIRDNNGWYALHVAAATNNLACMKILVSNDATCINKTSFDNKTPLILCAEKNNVEGLKYLLQQGADPNIRDNFEKSAMHSAAKNGSIEMVLELIENGADMNAQMFDRATPLHEAVEYNKPDVVSFLITHGADVNIGNDNNITPIFLSSFLGFPECLLAFLNIFRDSMTKEEFASVINTKDANGYTNLFLATSKGSLDCVQLLLSEGADPNVMSGQQSLLPLQCALENNDIEILKVLLLVTNHEAVYATGYSPYHFAFIDNEDATSTRLLIKSGYSITRCTRVVFDGNEVLCDAFPSLGSLSMTPLTDAILSRAPLAFCELLLEEDYSDTPTYQFPPLLAALSRNYPSLAERLIRLGAPINVYLPDFPFNFSLFACTDKEAFELLLTLEPELGSIFQDKAVDILLSSFREEKPDVCEHLEMVLCEALCHHKISPLPARLRSHISQEVIEIVDHFPIIRSLQEECKRIVWSSLSPRHILDGLKCFLSGIPQLSVHVVEYLLNIRN